MRGDTFLNTMQRKYSFQNETQQVPVTTPVLWDLFRAAQLIAA